MAQIYFDYDKCLLFEMMMEDYHMQIDNTKSKRKISKRFKSQQRYHEYFNATLRHASHECEDTGNYFEFINEQ